MFKLTTLVLGGVAALMTVSADASANDRDAFKYECRFEDKNAECFVSGHFCEEDEFTNSECDETSMRVRCTDDFRMRDNDAFSKSRRGDVTIVGRDDGSKAILEIEDVRSWHDEAELMNDSRGHDAQLTRIDGFDGEDSLRGECEVRKLRR